MDSQQTLRQLKAVLDDPKIVFKPYDSRRYRESATWEEYFKNEYPRHSERISDCAKFGRTSPMNTYYDGNKSFYISLPISAYNPAMHAELKKKVSEDAKATLEKLEKYSRMDGFKDTFRNVGTDISRLALYGVGAASALMPDVGYFGILFGAMIELFGVSICESSTLQFDSRKKRIMENLKTLPDNIKIHYETDEFYVKP
jgi:hypothetical protein